jgi:hypothetical protein
MVRCTDVSGLHCSSLLRAEDATDHEPPSQAEDLAVVAYPVFVWELFDAVAALVHGDVAQAAEHDHVFIFVVATVAYHTLCILLGTMLPRAAGIEL